MVPAKRNGTSLHERLPENGSEEEDSYRLYVIQKVRSGLHRADSEGVIGQDAAEARLSRWIVDETS